MPTAIQYRRLKHFRFTKMGIYQKDKRSYSMRGASIIIETTDGKQSVCCSTFDSTDSTMHVIYMFRWPAIGRRRQSAKLIIKWEIKTTDKITINMKKRDETHTKTFTFICPFALHFACYYASGGDDDCDVDVFLARGHRGAYLTYVTDFYDSLHISCGWSAGLSSAVCTLAGVLRWMWRWRSDAQ